MWFKPLTNSLPLAHPAVLRAHHSNQSIEIVAGEIVHIVLITLHSQELLAIVTALVLKLFDGLQAKRPEKKQN